MRPRQTGQGAAAETAPAVSKARFVTPMAARVVDALPGGEDWLYEVKFDGYRALVI